MKKNHVKIILQKKLFVNTYYLERYNFLCAKFFKTLIKKITHLQTYIVRHPILRAEKPIHSCAFQGDELNTTVHLGYYIQENLVGVISVFKNSSIFPLENQYQIRGMAVLTALQNQGIGQKLVNFAEQHIAQHNNDPYIIWLNARQNAVLFYKKLGYHIHGDEFEIESIGIHSLMYKQK